MLSDKGLVISIQNCVCWYDFIVTQKIKNPKIKDIAYKNFFVDVKLESSFQKGRKKIDDILDNLK